MVKSLPSPVESPSDDPYSFGLFEAVVAKDSADAEWAKAGREKEEKFGLYLTSLAKSVEAIRTAEKRIGTPEDSTEAVKELVNGTSDVLGPLLGEKVSVLSASYGSCV